MFFYQTSISTCFGHHYVHHQEKKTVLLPHTVFCAGCAGCGCVSWVASCVHCVKYTVRLTALMIGIMMPETCWDRSLIINSWLVGSCWFLCLHDARSQEPRTIINFYIVASSCILISRHDHVLYLVLSAFTSNPVSLLVTTKASVFPLCHLPLYKIKTPSFCRPSRPLFISIDWEISLRWMRWVGK